MRIMEARQFRDDIWSMVIDGSDASEWCLPHPAIRTHESQNLKGKKLQLNAMVLSFMDIFVLVMFSILTFPEGQMSLLNACIALS
jgi:hypothetical protein